MIRNKGPYMFRRGFLRADSAKKTEFSAPDRVGCHGN